MVLAQETGHRHQAFVLDDLGPARTAGLPVDVAEHLPALVIDAEQSRGVLKTDLLEVPQKFVNGRGPRVHRPPDRIRDADHPTMWLILEHLVIHHAR
ncbi:hypothetical protein [Dactylosporangium darangshiense]|uniref:hypothetical protein n=1 Tax=Dactylosporangium darangshiense TaxID=579108 RepID=UPI00363413FF